MKKIIITPILALFALSSYATTDASASQPLEITTAQTVVSATAKDYYQFISFTGNGTFKQQNHVYLNGTAGDNAGNIIVGENVQAIIEQADKNGLYLQYSGTTTTSGKISGANKQTSILDFYGNLIGTQYPNTDQQALEISDITLSMTYMSNYNQNTLRAAWIKFDNSKLVINTPETTGKKTKLEAGGYTQGDNYRAFQFYNSEVDIKAGATLYTGYRSNFTGSKSIHLDNTTLNVWGTLDLSSNETYINAENGSVINLKSGGQIKSSINSKLGNITLNLDANFSISTNASTTILKKQTTVANIAQDTTFTAQTMIMEASSTIDLNGKGSFTSSLITASNNAKLDISVAKANILEINVEANSTLLIDVASSSVAYIGLIRADATGGTFDVALSDTIMKDSLLIASADDLSIYNPEDSSFRFVTETGALRELGVNLWIEETVANSGVFTIYTTQVPEPAEWAVIFGISALAFVAYRKRR